MYLFTLRDKGFTVRYKPAELCDCLRCRDHV